MKDNLNEYNVTCYVTVGVTVHGVKAATATHAAMAAAVALADELETGNGLDCCDMLVVDDTPHEVTCECDGSDVDGFLVETVDGRVAERLDKNGNPVPMALAEEDFE